MSQTTGLSPAQSQELIDTFRRFLTDYYEHDVAQLAQRFPKEQRSIEVDWMDLFQFDGDLAYDLRQQPMRVRRCADQALEQIDLPADVDLTGAKIRVVNLPDRAIYPVDSLRAENVSSFVGVRGQVSRVSQVQPRPIDAVFECTRCGGSNPIPQSGRDLQEPYECSSCERQGPFILDEDNSNLVNHQLVRIQQPPEQTNGAQANNIDVVVEGDLVGAAKPGDRCTLNGVYRLADPPKNGIAFDTYLEGNAVELEETDYEDIEIDVEEVEAIAAGEYGDPYELLVGSINPKHHGDELIKLALGLQLFGGWRREEKSGAVERGDSHILLIGDPGSGKSSFLREMEALAPRSTYASGKGASAPGLTAAVVPDDFTGDGWTIKAGALVLADGGVACIDEIDKIDDEARSSLHDALESQRVHINKAGFNTHLRAETALLAAGNPDSGRFDPYDPIPEQIDLGPTLLSRFDLIFTFRDQPDPERDREIAEHKLASRRVAGQLQRGEDVDEGELDVIEPAIDADTLRAYVAHAKRTCYPTMSPEAETAIAEYFAEFRRAGTMTDGEVNPVPMTFRKLEAIQRLAEASARVRLSDTVTIDDAQRAVKLVKASMDQVGYDDATGQYDVDIIETGSSMSQGRRMERIPMLIEDHEALALDELVDLMDVDRATVVHDVQKLIDKGELYEMDGKLRRI